jgi:class 3 adenylate cyclase
MRSFARPVVGSGERILSTILFTDIVDSTAMAIQLGDAAWAELLARHNERGRFELDRCRGREIDTTGDGFLALSTARSVPSAVRPACARRRVGWESRSAP